jgi:hypothetical protein
MIDLLYANNAAGTLAAPLTNTATALTLNVGQAALFPNPSPPFTFFATITDAATQTLKEIVLVTAVSGNIFSITRGQDGTSAQSWNTGDIISQNVVAAELNGFQSAVNGVFTTVPIRPSSTLGIVGTTTNDNANAGSLGEYLSVTGPLMPITSSTVTNVTSMSLSAGDWDTQGVCYFQPGSPSSQVTLGVSLSSATLPSFTDLTSIQSTLGIFDYILNSPVVRIAIPTTQTLYLVGLSLFTGTSQVRGFLRARRVR